VAGSVSTSTSDPAEMTDHEDVEASAVGRLSSAVALRMSSSMAMYSWMVTRRESFAIVGSRRVFPIGIPILSTG
jgi:hypothetical protein